VSGISSDILKNNSKMKYMKQWSGPIGAAIWLIDGWIIFGSIILEPLIWVPNLIVGLLFTAIAAFWWLRSRAVNLMMADLPSTSLVRRFWGFETGLNILALLVATIALSAVISRAFGEGKAIFG
jgi:hypothetical protein